MDTSKYAEYVEHPRFGRGPIFTGVDPDPNDPNVHLHSRIGIMSSVVRDVMKREIFGTVPLRSDGDLGAIRGTAVAADVTKQTRETFPVTHYYDMDCLCRRCGKRFIFFALEQKYWYEELHFPHNADCVCCVPCRKKDRSIALQRKRYEDLCGVENQTVDEMLEMADCCVTLMEQGVFGASQVQHVRAIMNRLPTEQKVGEFCQKIVLRLKQIENENCRK
jgi:hypothetical protein